jgi:hypothetical protein
MMALSISNFLTLSTTLEYLRLASAAGKVPAYEVLVSLRYRCRHYGTSHALAAFLALADVTFTGSYLPVES